MACHWWNRWLHRKQRENDTVLLLPRLQLNAEKRLEGVVEPGTADWYRIRDSIVDDAFALHKQMPGQEHWHCACAQADGYT